MQFHKIFLFILLNNQMSNASPNFNQAAKKPEIPSDTQQNYCNAFCSAIDKETNGCDCINGTDTNYFLCQDICTAYELAVKNSVCDCSSSGAATDFFKFGFWSSFTIFLVFLF